MKQKEKEVVVREMKHSEELGCAIPSHWDVKALGEVAEFRRGPFGGALKKEIFVSTGYKVYEQKNAIYADYTLGKYFITEKKYKELKSFHLHPGDFIISCSGTIGKLYCIPVNAPLGIINQALLRLIIINDILYSKYFTYIFNMPILHNQIINSQGSAIKNIVQINILKKIPIPLPPVEEQEAIARVLGSADAVLDALAEQHAKTEALKTMLMQQLLSGTRSALDGAPMPMKHSEELGCAIAAHWDVKALGEIVYNYDKKRKPLKKQDRIKGQYPYYGASGIIDYIDSYLFDGEYLLIGEDGVKNMSLALIAKNKFWANNHVHVMQANEFSLNIYLVYIMNYININHYISGTIMPKLNQKSLQSINIPLPPVEEQEAIARVLGSADAVIDALAEQRATAEALKTMLMQQLLSGTRSALP